MIRELSEALFNVKREQSLMEVRDHTHRQSMSRSGASVPNVLCLMFVAAFCSQRKHKLACRVVVDGGIRSADPDVGGASVLPQPLLRSQNNCLKEAGNRGEMPLCNTHLGNSCVVCFSEFFGFLCDVCACLVAMVNAYFPTTFLRVLAIEPLVRINADVMVR